MERKTEYIGFRNRACDIVTVGCDWFDYRKGEDDLPTVGAFCKNCGTETAKPVYPIFFHCNPAYALKCTKCGSEYPMYKSMYIERYVGYDTKSGGHVNPTHGQLSRIGAMDRKARDYHNNIPKMVEDRLCNELGYTHEEYQEMRRRRDEHDKQFRKKMEREDAERRSRYQEEERTRESNKRKELIEKGILKYVKNVGLVNTETGEVVKL